MIAISRSAYMPTRTRVALAAVLVPFALASCGGKEPTGRAMITLTKGFGMASVSAGNEHTCGVTVNGTAYCWGNNAWGQLGNGDTTGTVFTTPQEVAGGLRFAAVSAGVNHTCGITSAGAAYCWGGNPAYPLGNGQDTSSTVPVAVSGSSGLTFRMLGTGLVHTCALTTTGAAYCWGNNALGELGTGDWSSSASPRAVVGGLTFTTISVGWEHACGLTPTGSAYCWGVGTSGQLGDSSSQNSWMPVPVRGGHAFTAVGAGMLSTCGVTSAGTIYCWGDNGSGELGNGTTVNSNVPVAVSGAIGFATVTEGEAHACAVTNDGLSYCWGDGSYGQLGDGSTSNVGAPTPVVLGLSFTAISGGGVHTCGVTQDWGTLCWGRNLYGELGNGTKSTSSQPMPVAAP